MNIKGTSVFTKDTCSVCVNDCERTVSYSNCAPGAWGFEKRSASRVKLRHKAERKVQKKHPCVFSRVRQLRNAEKTGSRSPNPRNTFGRWPRLCVSSLKWRWLLGLGIIVSFVCDRRLLKSHEHIIVQTQWNVYVSVCAAMPNKVIEWLMTCDALSTIQDDPRSNGTCIGSCYWSALGHISSGT